MPEQYNDNSIKSLKGAERVRQRPGVMFGSDDINGAFHTFTEILGNSLDEGRGGFGDKVHVIYHADKSISVIDEGRGVPMGWNEAEGRYNWDLIFNELYAGGKYDESNEGYEFSIGLNGLGSAATQYTSEYMTVTSHRPEGIYSKDFKKGIPTEDEMTLVPNTTGKTGTTVHWKVDNEVFHDTNFTTQMFTRVLEGQAHLNKMTMSFLNESTGESFTYEGEGVEDYLKSKLGDVVIDMMTGQAESSGSENGKQYRVKADFVLAITQETVSKSMHFHNTGAMRKGVHFSAFNDAVTSFFKSVSSQHDIKILPNDYIDYLSVLTSTYSNVTSFANQTKDGVSNMFVYNLIYKKVLDMLNEASATNRPSVKTLIDNVVIAAKARIEAKELERLARQVGKLSKKKNVEAEKFVGCDSNDTSIKELYIVEGDSAKGSCRKARDSHFQAILPVKGKPMNGFKKSIKALLENQEVKDIVSTIGTGIDIPGANTFDITKSQFSKIIIATDADVDGNQIRVLVYSVIARLMPKLLEAGMVYVAETPLFEFITFYKGKTESLFAYTPEEKELIMKQCQEEGRLIKNINRSKGLGQNDPEMLSLTTMAPETRRLVQLKIDQADMNVHDVNTMLFGDDPNKERKPFVFSLLEEALGEELSLEDLSTTINALEEEAGESLDALIDAELEVQAN